MRILLTADPELPVPPNLYGGIERIIDFVARGLHSKGHTVGLVAHRDSTCAVDQHFAWPGLRSQSLSDTIANTSYLWQITQKFRPYYPYCQAICQKSCPTNVNPLDEQSIGPVGWVVEI
jgi:hypothetical protein